VRQWQTCRVQDLGLPVRWNYLTIFSSDVSRIVLLSDRGRTHGSIWGEFLIPIGCAQGYVTIGE
jgi:hypothetical protein